MRVKEGDDYPTFEMDYSGFKNNETEDVLTVKPTATTTASSTSSPGAYPIIVSGGEADNYFFVYVDGILTILESNAVDNIYATDTPFDIYDLTGHKVLSNVTKLQNIPKGIYIIKNRKVIIK